MVAIGSAFRIKPDDIGREARADRREHGVGHGRLGAEQEGAAIAAQAIAPDRDDALYIGLGQVINEVHNRKIFPV